MKKILLFISLLCLFAAPAWGATYYIDPTCATPGNGTSGDCLGGANDPFDQWSDVTWAAGNTYLQKAGTTANERLTIGESGTSLDSPIYVGKYGSGSAPTLNSSMNYDIYSSSKNFITIEDFNLIGATTYSIYFDNGGDGLVLRRITSNRDIRAKSYSNSTYEDITITASGTNAFALYGAASNVAVRRVHVSNNTNSGFYLYNITNLILEDSDVSGNSSGAAVDITSGAGTLAISRLTITGGARGLSMSNSAYSSGYINYLSVTGTNNIGWSMASVTGSLVAESPILVNNKIYGASFGSVDSLTVNNGVASGTIHTATTDGSGWLATSSTIIYNNCKAYDNQWDGFVINTDGTGMVYNRCLAYNNGTNPPTDSSGDGFTIHGLAGASYNYCISRDNKNTGFAFVNAGIGSLANCVAYNNGGAETVRGGFYAETGGAAWTVKNSIFHGNKPREIFLDAAALGAFTADFNLYYHDADANFASIDGGASNISWTTYHETYEANSLHSDPLFVDAANADFRLQNGSPAISTGVYVTGLHDQAGITDFSGQDLYNLPAPDIGAYGTVKATVISGEAVF